MESASLISQYSEEAKSWTVLLELAAQDTSYSLSRCREEQEGKQGMADAETIREFQVRFSAQEKIIIYLAGEVARQATRLQHDLHEDGSGFRQVSENQKKLQKDIRVARELFEKNNNEFLAYLNHTF